MYKIKHVSHDTTLLYRPCVPERIAVISLLRCRPHRLQQRNTPRCGPPCSKDCSCTGFRGNRTPILSEAGSPELSCPSFLVDQAVALICVFHDLNVNAHPQPLPATVSRNFYGYRFYFWNTSTHLIDSCFGYHGY